ncbi:MAG TPA: glycosyltransferase [Verrucomicrobiae bacterium]|nr:glycosyltransferase [Verrucomicrobiae bacterium]
MKISLIISTYEQPLALAKTIEGVRLQSRRPDEVFITDDGSADGTRDLIERFRVEAPFPVQHLWHPHDGFRKVILLNQAVAAARGDYLVFTDGDCVAHRHHLRDHEKLAERGFWVQGRRSYVKEPFVAAFEPGKTSVSAWLLRRRMYGWPKAIRLPMPVVFRDRKQRGIIGCNMAFWRSDVLEVNGFDEEWLGRGIGPDSDLGTRVYNLGRKRKFVYGHALVYHLDHPVMPRDNLEAKKKWLEDTIRSGKKRCDRGVSQYLDQARAGKAPTELQL